MKSLKKWIAQKGNLAFAALSSVALLGGMSHGKLFAFSYFKGDPNTICTRTCSLSPMTSTHFSGAYNDTAGGWCTVQNGDLYPNFTGTCHNLIVGQPDLIVEIQN